MTYSICVFRASVLAFSASMIFDMHWLSRVSSLGSRIELSLCSFFQPIFPKFYCLRITRTVLGWVTSHILENVQNHTSLHFIPIQRTLIFIPAGHPIQQINWILFNLIIIILPIFDFTLYSEVSLLRGFKMIHINVRIKYWYVDS